MPHKHADVIKAWADGAEIQYRCKSNRTEWSEWMPCNGPSWSTANEYRVKPTPVPLCEVAREAFFKGPDNHWQKVADAVVKAYEEQKRAT